MLVRLLLTLLLLVPLAPARAERIAIRDVAVVDVAAGRIERGRTIIVDGRTIRAVGPATMREPGGARVIDGRGRYAIPGLWDMGSVVLDGLAERVPGGLELMVAHGVVGTRDLNTAMPLAEVAALDRAIANGTRIGPKLIWTGRLLHQSTRAARPNMARLDRLDDLIAEIEHMAAAGAHYVRLSHGVREEHFPMIVAAARAKRLPVTAWLVSSWSDAVASGIAGTEHFADLYRTTARRPERDLYLATYRDEALRQRYMGDAGSAYRFIEALRPLRDEPYYRATIAAVAKAGTPVTSNMVTMHWARPLLQDRYPARARFAMPEPRSGPPPANAATDASGREIRADLLDLLRGGVPVLAGTVAGQGVHNIPGASLHDELELMVRAGFTPREALAAATVEPARQIARLFPRVKAARSVAPGEPADLVLLDADPLASIANVARVHAVVANGRWIGPEQRAALLERAAALAAH
jgi:hypothetical protein